MVLEELISNHFLHLEDVVILEEVIFNSFSIGTMQWS